MYKRQDEVSAESSDKTVDEKTDNDQMITTDCEYPEDSNTDKEINQDTECGQNGFSSPTEIRIYFHYVN